MSEVDLRRFSIFAELEEAELRLVAFLLESREFRADQEAWREGQAGDGLWLLDRGTLRFEAHSEGPLGTCDAPAWFGSASLIAEAPRQTTAHAAGAAQVRVLSRTAFAQLLDAEPRIAARVLAAIAAELVSLLHDGITFMPSRR